MPIAPTRCSGLLQNKAQFSCSTLDRTWGLRCGNLSSDWSQDTYETCRTKGLLLGEQRSTIAGNFACLNMFDAYDYGWGICLILIAVL